MLWQTSRWSEPASEGSEPDSEGSEPASEGSEPASEGSEPASEWPELASEGPDPASEEPELASEGPDPASEGPDPASERGGRTYGRTDGRTDSPCILQDFVPSSSLRGRCPAYIIEYFKQMPRQGKGTDDHLLPLGDWFLPSIRRTSPRLG